MPDCLLLTLLLLQVVLLRLILPEAGRLPLVLTTMQAVVWQVLHHCCRLGWHRVLQLHQVHLASAQQAPKVVTQMELQQLLGCCH